MELFAVFDRNGQQLGLRPRHEVHREGLWHKSAQVLVFDVQGRLLMQQRAADKDLYANLWDYSVGEHLQPGESFREAAVRGLREELGVTEVDHFHPLGGQRWVEIETRHHADREIQQAFRCEYQGVLRPDPVEVAQVKYMALPDLAAWLAAAPDAFTPWFVADIEAFGLFAELNRGG